jgi:hypothetical protein
MTLVLTGDIYGVHAILVASAHGSLACMGYFTLVHHYIEEELHFLPPKNVSW